VVELEENMARKCFDCGMAVYMDTNQNRRILRDARDPDHPIHNCSVKNMLKREKRKLANFLASVKPDTARALL
jgi:hypothetical protein